MRAVIIRNLSERMRSYAELIAGIDESALNARLDIPKDKTIREHLWCIVGARESYAKALAAGEWQGFSCSMTAYEPGDFERALADSARAVTAAIGGVAEWTDSRDDLLAALSEHEVMHEGQIIRHVYALGRTLPASWRWA